MLGLDLIMIPIPVFSILSMSAHRFIILKKKVGINRAINIFPSPSAGPLVFRPCHYAEQKRQLASQPSDSFLLPA